MEQSKAIAQGSEAPTNKKSKKIKSKRPDEISIDEVVPGPGAEKQKKPVQFGDEDFSIENVSHSIASKLVAIDEEKVSWEEIWGSCCFHTGKEWANIAAGVVALLFCLYFFLFSLQLMGNASKVMAGCGSGVLFGSDASPLSSLMIGILTTVLLQSSTTVVAVVVSLEEAKAMSVQAGIFTVMGANIGTTITAALVTLGQMRDMGELERGVSAAATHSLFNFMTVAILFPVECVFGYLEALTGALIKGAETGGKEDSYVGPIRKLIQPLVDKIIISNSKLITGVAKGKMCDDFYPIQCDPDFDPSYKTCKFGLIACDKVTGNCPLFFREDATIEEDKLSGGITFIIAIIILVASTMGMIALIKFLLHGLSVRVVHAVTRCNGYFGILLGGAATVFVQSSQAVVSIMVPFAGVGALPLETIYPIVVGSNVGTALQTVMTSMSAFGPEPLQVALAHLFFNVTGMLLWYPIPHLRAVPLWAARRLGQGAKTWRLFPILSILGLYIVIPLLTFGLLELYQSGGTGARVFVILVFVGGGLALGAILYWCKYRGGDEKYLAFVGRLSSRRRGGRGGQSVATDPSYNGGDDWDVRKSLAEAAAFTGSPRKSARSLGNSLRSSFQSLTGLPPVLTATPTSPKTSMPLPSLPLPPLERSTHSKLSECFADSVISIDEDWDKDPITF